jgi:phosphoenolpyruvate carboxykinase (GTP)
MLPFCGYNMSDYFQHWLDMEKRLESSGRTLPKVYCVNWFRKGADGKFVWPGYGDNMRVLKWMIERIEGQSGGEEHFFGISPRHEDIEWTGLEFTPEQFAGIIDAAPDAWREELKLHQQLFDQLAYHLPQALKDTKARMEAHLAV